MIHSALQLFIKACTRRCHPGVRLIPSLHCRINQFSAQFPVSQQAVLGRTESPSDSRYPTLEFIHNDAFSFRNVEGYAHCIEYAGKYRAVLAGCNAHLLLRGAPVAEVWRLRRGF